MKCTECGQEIGADVHPRVRQAAQIATQAIFCRLEIEETGLSEMFRPKELAAEVEEIIVTTLELAGLTEPKGL